MGSLPCKNLIGTNSRALSSLTHSLKPAENGRNFENLDSNFSNGSRGLLDFWASDWNLLVRLNYVTMD
jgi:hypothetical protein